MIRWPWVSRARLEAAEARADEYRREWQSATEREAARWHAEQALREELTGLIRDLTKKPDPPPMPTMEQPPVRELPKELRHAIDDMTAPNSRERRAVEAEVWSLTDKGLPDSEIEKMVRYGQEVEL